MAVSKKTALAFKSYQNHAQVLVKTYLLADAFMPYTSILGGIFATKMVYDLTQLISTFYFRTYAGLTKIQRIEWNNRGMSSIHAIFITAMALYFVFWSDLYSDQYTAGARQDWENIQEELNQMQEEVGEDGEVDETEVLKRALGERRGYSRGVGRKPSFDSSFSRASTSKSKKSRNSQKDNASKAELGELRKAVGDFFQQYSEHLKAHIPNYTPLPIPAQFLGDTSSVDAPEDSYGEDDEDDDEEGTNE